MPGIIETTVYTIDELSEAAKDKARCWFRENLIFDWWDDVYEDFAEICPSSASNWRPAPSS